MAELVCCDLSMNAKISSIRTDENAVIVVFDVDTTTVSFQETINDLRCQVFNENSRLRKCFPKLDIDFGVKESYFLQFGKSLTNSSTFPISSQNSLFFSEKKE